MGRFRTIPTLIAAALVLAACDDMRSQPAYQPQDPAPEFPGGQTTQPPIEGTVARGALDSDENADPHPLTRARLEHGRERYAIFCAPCHDGAGTGQGVIVQRGFPEPPSLHSEPLREAPDRHIFDVITHGSGDMYPYADKIPAEDRWAIVAYVRALQLSQHAPLDVLNEDDLRALGEP